MSIQREVDKNYMQLKTACDPSQVSRAFGISVWQGSGHATPDKFEFSMKLITIKRKYKLHVILRKYHVHFGISVWQGSGHATPDKFEFSVKSITITCK